MELRQLTAEDYSQATRLSQESFGGGSRSWPPDTMAEHWLASRRVGVFEGARMVAVATVHDMHLTWGDHDVPMGGVAGVGCTTAERGKGHVARLLDEALIAMREAGQYLSGLYPFAYAFYQRHGWEWVGEMVTNTAPIRELSSAPEGRSIQTFEHPAAIEKIAPIHAAFARRYRGMNTREGSFPDWWDRKIGHHDNRTTYVHVYSNPESGEGEGYLSFRFPKPGGDPGEIGDFFALTPAAYRGLLSVLHYYGTQMEKATYEAPADDPLPFHLMHKSLGRKIDPLFMGRIVDVKAAFEALTPRPEITGELTLTVSDRQCDWNNATFRIAAESGRITAEKIAGDAALTMDIRALTQAYWGQPSLDRIRMAERMEVTNEPAYALLSELLPPTICYLQDFF